MTEVPEYIEIGARLFAVQLVPAADWPDSYGTEANIHYAEQTIRINEAVPARDRPALLHCAKRKAERRMAPAPAGGKACGKLPQPSEPEIPDTVRVCGELFKVFVVPAIIDADGVPCRSRICYDCRLVCINKAVPAAERPRVFAAAVSRIEQTKRPASRQPDPGRIPRSVRVCGRTYTLMAQFQPDGLDVDFLVNHRQLTMTLNALLPVAEWPAAIRQGVRETRNLLRRLDREARQRQ
jgi:hypothetical protein